MALPLLQLGLGFPPAWNARRCLNSRGDGFSVFVALPTSESNVTKIGSGKHVISLSDERNTILGASMLRRIFDPTGVPGVRVADSAQAACLVVVPLHRECCCDSNPSRRNNITAAIALPPLCSAARRDGRARISLLTSQRAPFTTTCVTTCRAR